MLRRIYKDTKGPSKMHYNLYFRGAAHRKSHVPLAAALAFLLLFSATFAAAASGPASLRLNFSKGDVFHYTLDMNGIVEMAVKAPEIPAAESASMPPMDPPITPCSFLIPR